MKSGYIATLIGVFVVVVALIVLVSVYAVNAQNNAASTQSKDTQVRNLYERIQKIYSALHFIGGNEVSDQTVARELFTGITQCPSGNQLLGYIESIQSAEAYARVVAERQKILDLFTPEQLAQHNANPQNDVSLMQEISTSVAIAIYRDMLPCKGSNLPTTI